MGTLSSACMLTNCSTLACPPETKVGAWRYTRTHDCVCARSSASRCTVMIITIFITISIILPADRAVAWDAEPPTEYDADGSLTISSDTLADVAAITVTVSFESPTAQRSPAAAAETAGALAQARPAAVPFQNGADSRGQPPSSLQALPGAAQQLSDGAGTAFLSPPVRSAKAGSVAAAPRARAQSETRPSATLPPRAGSSLGPPRPASTGPPPRAAAGAAAGAQLPVFRQLLACVLAGG